MSVRSSTPSVAAHPLDRLRDVLARVVDVVVPADRDRGELRQIADDHLGGVHQLGRELPVRDDDDANHAVTAPTGPVPRMSQSSVLHPDRRDAGRARGAVDRASARRSRSAIITDRWRPPVQPIAIVR